MAQSLRTLKMLRPFRINPKLSADAFLEGQHDYNAVPFPPLGWRMLIFEGPEKRSSWVLHGVEGFSVGPAEKNYRCYKGWVPTTGVERISDTVVFFPPKNIHLTYHRLRQRKIWYRRQIKPPVPPLTVL